jgi:hypothetical protein
MGMAAAQYHVEHPTWKTTLKVKITRDQPDAPLDAIHGLHLRVAAYPDLLATLLTSREDQAPTVEETSNMTLIPRGRFTFATARIAMCMINDSLEKRMLVAAVEEVHQGVRLLPKRPCVSLGRCG